MTIAPALIPAIASIAVSAAGTGVALATRPGTPKIAIPEAPPPPPPPAPAPPPAPTEAEAEEGVAKFRKRRSRQFGLEQTLLAQRTPLGGGNGLLAPSIPGRSATLGGG